MARTTNGGPSIGAKVGIGIGVAVGVIFAIALARYGLATRNLQRVGTTAADRTELPSPQPARLSEHYREELWSSTPVNTWRLNAASPQPKPVRC